MCVRDFLPCMLTDLITSSGHSVSVTYQITQNNKVGLSVSVSLPVSLSFSLFVSLSCFLSLCLSILFNFLL